MRFDIVTIFPEIFRGVFEFGIIRRAVEAGLIEINLHDLRDYTYDRHHQVDDRPFGGGAGMVMKPEPLFRAIDAITHNADQAAIVMLSPQGRLFTQGVADEVSIGDVVLSGGEIPAMVVVDAVTRLIPGALGSLESAERDSFADGLLDYPHYTRPVEYRGLRAPDVLMSGHHGEIEKWRRRKAMEKTLKRRPDLLERRALSEDERRLVGEILREMNKQ